MYLSTILDDYSRYIISWKLCTTMKTSDVTETLNMALEASGWPNGNNSAQKRPTIGTSVEQAAVPQFFAISLKNGKFSLIW